MRGKYWLTHNPITLLLVDKQEINSPMISYQLFLSEGSGTIQFVLSDEFNFSKELISRAFRMYDVKGEQSYKEGIHLELNKGLREWVCYMLPSGLPDTNNSEKSMYVTNECITN